MTRLCFLCAFATVGHSQTAATKPQFEVATVRINKSGLPIARGPSVKNRRFTAENLSLKTLIGYAYGVLRFQTTGPAWFDVDHYDIAATIPEGAPAEQAPRMLQALLEDRFKVEIHREAVEQNVYALLVDKGGAKFLDFHPAAPFTPKFPEGQQVKMTTGPVARFGEFLSIDAGRPIVDHTGIQGEYRLLVTFVPLRADGGAPVNPGPDLFTAVREQLGLRLEARREPVEMLRVDRAERIPEEN